MPLTKRKSNLTLCLLNAYYKYRHFHRKPYSKLLYLLTVQLMLFLVLLYNYKAVYEKLEQFELYLKTNNLRGKLILLILLVLSSIPPIPGFGTLLMFSGYTYSFATGILMGLIGCLIGASTSYVLAITILTNCKWVRQIITNYNAINNIMGLLRKNNYKTMVMVRMCPYPYSIINVVLGIANISYKTFVVGLVGLLPKLVGYVYFGSQLESLSHKNALTPSRIVMFVVSLLFGAFVSYYLYKKSRSMENDLPIVDSYQLKKI